MSTNDLTCLTNIPSKLHPGINS